MPEQIRYKPERDFFAPRADRAYGALAAAIALTLMVRVGLHFSGVLPICVSHLDLLRPNLELCFAISLSANFAALKLCFAISLSVCFAAIVADYVFASWLSKRRGKLSFERTIKRPFEAPGEALDRMVARLVQLGYSTTLSPTKPTAEVCVRPLVAGHLSYAFSGRIARIPHQIKLEARPEGAGSIVRVVFRYEARIVDTGESEYASRIMQYLESEASHLELRRSADGWSSQSLFITTASVVTSFWNLSFAPLSSQLALLFSMFAIGLIHFRRRSAYGRRYALPAFVIALVNVLLFV